MKTKQQLGDKRVQAMQLSPMAGVVCPISLLIVSRQLGFFPLLLEQQFDDHSATTARFVTRC